MKKTLAGLFPFLMSLAVLFPALAEEAPSPSAEQEFETDTYNPTDPFMNEKLKDEDIDEYADINASAEDEFEADTYNPSDPYMNKTQNGENKNSSWDDLHNSYPE